MSQSMEWLKERDKELKLLGGTLSLLYWDAETYMPKAGAAGRAQQVAILAGIVHDKGTDPERERHLENASNNSDNSETDKALLRVLKKEYQRERAIPRELAVNWARTTREAHSAWVEAKHSDSFDLFAPHLEKILELVYRKVDALGYEEHPYDALLEDYEPGMTTGAIKPLFAGLKEQLLPLIESIKRSKQVESDFLLQKFPENLQRTFSLFLLEKMGYRLDAGRLDTVEHPFCTSIGPGDTRVTTHFYETQPASALFSTIHEGGHALYDQGFSKEILGSSLAAGCSYGIHESQSRFWENIVGRSLPFWGGVYPSLIRLFPDQLKKTTLRDFYRAINRVEPSFIRIEADEVTYPLHVMLRFNLEVQLLEKKLKVKDLPEAWAQESASLLGISPKKVSQGVLQDVHWSSGLFGYFPSYALGTLYSAQFYHVMQKQIPDMDSLLLEGDYSPVLAWLREKIHQHGAAPLPSELVLQVTGEPLKSDYFISYLKHKYGKIYI